jgi:hypothetical protein
MSKPATESKELVLTLTVSLGESSPVFSENPHELCQLIGELLMSKASGSEKFRRSMASKIGMKQQLPFRCTVRLQQKPTLGRAVA